MMSFIQQFYQDCLIKFALMGRIPIRHNLPAVAYYGAEHILVQTDTIPIRTLLQNRSCQFPSYEI